MKKIFLITALAIAAWSCKKEDPVGPNIEDLYGIFKINDSLSTDKPDGVDFSKGETVQFKGSWTTSSEWTLTIKGRRSGSIKTINGKSKTLDTSLSVWNGTSNSTFFKKEMCDVTLTFKNNKDEMHTSVSVLGLHDYSKDGYILADFESSVAVEYWGGDGKSKTITDTLAPQGSKYFFMSGKETAAAYWLGSFAPFTTQKVINATHYPFNDADTATVYLNCFVRGHDLPNSTLTLQFKEDDNGDGVYQKTEDSYTIRLAVSGTDWKKISVPLKDFTHDAGAGNSIKEISKISEFYVMLFSTGVPTPQLGFDIDFIILTKGKPL